MKPLQTPLREGSVLVPPTLSGMGAPSEVCVSGREARDDLYPGRAGHIACCPGQAGDGEDGAGASINNRTEEQDCPGDALEHRRSQFL